MSRPFSYLIVALLLLTEIAFAQGQKFNIYPDSLNKKRLKTMIISESAIYAASMIGLHNLWYKDYPQTNFHFTNDNDHWRLMDKMGHVFSTYNIGRLGYANFRWAGLSENKSTWLGGLLGFTYLSIIEAMDGYSVGWGASPGDMIANTVGSSLFISQQLLWHEQRIMIKYSYHPTDFPDLRPDVLGNNTIERLFDDYNGITIWASANIYSFLKKESKFPKWLNIAFGYGAHGLLYGNNLDDYNGPPLPEHNRISQFYLALDLDLTRIPTQSKFMHLLFNVLSFIKIPLPTFEINSNGGFKFHPLYF